MTRPPFYFYIAVAAIALSATSCLTRFRSAETWAVISDADSFLHDQWRPDAASASKAIAAIRLHLEEEARGAGSMPSLAAELLRDWDGYRCQIVGHVEEGRRLIHLNLFTYRLIGGDSWRKDYVTVYDGGSLFWQAEIDADSMQVVYYIENGTA